MTTAAKARTAKAVAHPEGVAIVSVGARGEQSGGDEGEAAAESEGAADQCHCSGKLVRSDLFAQYRQGQWEDRGGGALEDSAENQQGQGLGEGGDHGSDDHDAEHGHQGLLLAVLVAESAEEWGEDGRGEQGGGGHPTDVGDGGVEVLLDEAEDRDGQGLHHRHDHGGDAQREDDDRFVSVAGSSRGVAWFTSGGVLRIA